MVAGFLLLFLGGLCQGSFGMGYKKHSPFLWAAFWGIYNIMCMLTASLFVTLTAPSVWTLAAQSGIQSLSVPLLCGALWGLSAICFSKSIDKIGMSMVYGISMGVSTIVGALTPMVAKNTFPTGVSLYLFIAGLVLTVAGVAIVTAAGIVRDGGAKSSIVGIVLCLLSGLGSGAMNMGFVSASFLGEGIGGAAASGAAWLFVLLGGCATGLIWCIGEVIVRREWHTIVAKGSGRRTLILFAVSIVWYAALLLYGIASSMMGDLGASVGWILFNALALMVSLGWGIWDGEWRGEKKGLLFVGCAILIVAWIFTALV